MNCVVQIGHRFFEGPVTIDSAQRDQFACSAIVKFGSRAERIAFDEAFIGRTKSHRPRQSRRTNAVF